MRISDWSSDVCSSDLDGERRRADCGCAGKGVGNWRHGKLPLCRSSRIAPDLRQADQASKIGRASCRERVCQNVSISVVAVSLKKKSKKQQNVSKHSITQMIKNIQTQKTNYK